MVAKAHAPNLFVMPHTRARLRRWNLSPLFVHFVSRPETDLENRRVLVEEVIQPFAHRQPPHFTLALVPGLAPTLAQSGLLLGNRITVSAQYFTSRGC